MLLEPTFLPTGFLVLLAVLFAAPAHADDSVVSNQAKVAEALFRSGRESLKQGDHALACRRFAESYWLAPREAGPLLNLAECEARNKQYLRAIAFAESAMANLTPDDPRKAFAEASLRGFREHVVHVAITMPADAPPSTTVTFDGRALDRHEIKVPLPADPGPHSILVVAPGFANRVFDVSLNEGATRTVLLSLGERLPASATEHAPPPPRSTTERTAGLIVGVAGLGVLALGSASGILALDRAATARDRCGSDGGCDTEGYGAGRDAKTFATASTVGIVAGVLAIGTGIYLFLDGRSRASRVVAASTCATCEPSVRVSF